MSAIGLTGDDVRGRAVFAAGCVSLEADAR